MPSIEFYFFAQKSQESETRVAFLSFASEIRISFETIYFQHSLYHVKVLFEICKINITNSYISNNIYIGFEMLYSRYNILFV